MFEKFPAQLTWPRRFTFVLYISIESDELQVGVIGRTYMKWQTYTKA